jgi:DNA-binding LacI/PurR family transcriptional regulator
MVVTVPAADSTPERLPFLLARHRPVGCIVECFGNETRLMPKSFGSLPAVWLDVPSETHGDIDGRLSVCVDDKAIARTALRELSANFPKSLAAVEYQWFPHEERRKWSRDRAEAFRALATAEEFPCEVFDSRPGESPGERTERLAHWLSRLPRPSGVFAVNDGAAFNVRAACRAAGLSIPRDVSIVGFDDDPIAEWASPPLTTVRQDFGAMGREAVKALVARIEKPAASGVTVKMPVELVERESLVRNAKRP